MADALEDLHNGGKAMFTVEDAIEMAKIFGAVCRAELIYVWTTPQEAFAKYEIFPYKNGPGMAVNGGELLQDILIQVMESRGISTATLPSSEFIGRGFKARANAKYLRELMEAEFGTEIEPDPVVDIAVDVLEDYQYTEQ